MRVIVLLKDDATFKILLPYLNESAEIIFVDENNKITDKNFQPLPFKNIVECLFTSKWNYIMTQGDFIKQLSDLDIDSTQIIDVDFILNDDYAKRNCLAVGLCNKISDFESVIIGDFAAIMGFNADEFLVKTANLSSSCQDLKISYLWLKAALTAPNSKIKYAVIGLSPYALRYDLDLTADKWESLAYYSIFKGQMNFPLTDDVMSALFDENFLNDYESANAEYTANAEKYADLNFSDPLGEKKLHERNLIQKDVYGIRADVRKWETEKYFHAAQSNIKIFIDCLKLCREHNVTPIIVKMPVNYFYKTIYSKELYSELESTLYRAKRLVPFRLIDAFSWNVFDTMDFCRIDVLNYRGAKKLTHAVNTLFRSMWKTKIKIAIVSQGGNMDKILPIYELIQKRKDTDVYLLSSPPHEDADVDKPFEADAEDYLNAYGGMYRNYGNNENTTIVKVLTEKGATNLELYHFDYVFYIRPYEWLLPPNLQCQNVAHFAKTCYIPYGVLNAEWSIEFALRNADFFNNLNFFFPDFEGFAEYARQFYKTDLENSDQQFLFLGSPEMEDFGQFFASKFETNLTKKRKSVIWAPRWNYHKLAGGSHFLEYKDNFTALRKKYPDLKLTVRPHRNLFKKMLQDKRMTEEDIQAYKDSLVENDIHLDEHDSLKIAFLESDIMIADMTTIIPTYFLTGNPIIYCPRNPPQTWAGNSKVMEPAIYRAENWEDVEKYLEMLLNGEDPLKDERRRIIEEMHKLHNGAAEKIVQCIIDDYYKNKI